MAYRKKVEYILKYPPDLVVVPECEYFEESAKTLWFGDNRKKGIGIFAKGLKRPMNLIKVQQETAKYGLAMKGKEDEISFLRGHVN